MRLFCWSRCLSSGGKRRFELGELRLLRGDVGARRYSPSIFDIGEG